jgi:uncharacterized phage infection (PIP) family protein YhgE
VSEERLARIESKLDGLAETVGTLTGTVGTLAGTVATLVEGQAQLQVGFAKLEAGQAKLEAGQAKLEAGQEELQAGQMSLGNQMRILYEDTLDKMKALDPAPLMATVRREIAEAQEGVIRRLDLIELSVGELWKRQAP